MKISNKRFELKFFKILKKIHYQFLNTKIRIKKFLKFKSKNEFNLNFS